MSDDEDEVAFTRKEKVLHYGSLAEQEKARLDAAGSTGSLAQDAIKAGISAGNINLSSGNSTIFSVLGSKNWTFVYVSPIFHTTSVM